MFEKWNIPDNICDNFPIGKDTLSLFVGHNAQSEFLKKLMNNKALIVLEGDIGVGKTSLGNFVRHSIDNILTPINEIPCSPEWNNDTFMTVILANIIKSVDRKNPKHRKFAGTAIFKRVEKIFSDIDSINFGISIAGTGGSLSKNISRSSILNQTILIEYLHKIVQSASEHIKNTSPIILQLNNIDICHTFSEKEVAKLFNNIRDIMQIPGINWIINGYSSLSGYLNSRVPRFGQIISKSETVQPLALNEMKEVFERRIKNSNGNGKLPLSDELLSIIHNISSGSFREILKVINQLLIEYSSDPLANTIEQKHARAFFRKNLEYQMLEIERKKTLYDIFVGIINNPGVNQKKLCEKISKTQTLVSKYTKVLQEKGLIRTLRKGITNHYYPSADFYIGFYIKNIEK